VVNYSLDPVNRVILKLPEASFALGFTPVKIIVNQLPEEYDAKITFENGVLTLRTPGSTPQ
jgi:hypothetical protein